MLFQSQSTCHRIIREDARGESSAVDPDSAKMPNPKVRFPRPKPLTLPPVASSHIACESISGRDAPILCQSLHASAFERVRRINVDGVPNRRVRASKPAAGGAELLQFFRLTFTSKLCYAQHEDNTSDPAPSVPRKARTGNDWI